MKRAILIFCLFASGILLTIALAWKPWDRGIKREFTIDPSLFTEVVPGLSYALLSPGNQEERFYIGDELTFWLFIEYEREEFVIDPDSPKTSSIEPFVMRSFLYKTRSISSSFELAFFEMKLQCVTCAPGASHSLDALRLVWWDVASPEKTEELAFRLGLNEKFFFNTDEFRLRPLDREIFMPDVPNTAFISGGGVLLMGIGFGLVGLFFPRRRKIVSPSTPSHLDSFTAEITRLRSHDASIPEERREVLQAVYEATARFAFRMYDIDLMIPTNDVSVLPAELLALLKGAKRAYVRKAVSEKELALVFADFDAFLSNVHS